MVTSFEEIHSDSVVRKSDLPHFDLPQNFDDDKNFDKSGFIPELDFSHFFKRIDFDRSLNDVFDNNEPNSEASKSKDRIVGTL